MRRVWTASEEHAEGASPLVTLCEFRFPLKTHLELYKSRIRAAGVPTSQLPSNQLTTTTNQHQHIQGNMQAFIKSNMTLIAPSTAASTRASTSGTSRAIEQLSNRLQLASISSSTTLYPMDDTVEASEGEGHTPECLCVRPPTSKANTPHGVIEVEFCTCFVQEANGMSIQSPRIRWITDGRGL